MLKYYFRHFNLMMRSRKGLDKPIFIVGSLTLAIMFLMAYYLSTTGWIEGIGQQFNDIVSGFSADIGESQN